MRRFVICVSLPLLLVAATARSEMIPFNLEIGYRWANVSGNEGVYRSQINEDSGLILRAFTMTAPGFRIDSSDVGASPTSSFRIEASQQGMYRLRLGYRRMDAFNELPGQHMLDRARTLLDA